MAPGCLLADMSRSLLRFQLSRKAERDPGDKPIPYSQGHLRVLALGMAHILTPWRDQWGISVS